MNYQDQEDDHFAFTLNDKKMTHEKFTEFDITDLMAESMRAIEIKFDTDVRFTADVTDMSGHFDEDTGLYILDIKIKFNKI